MLPKWFNVDAIPFESMCYDSQFWLPLIIQNKKVDVYFKYDRNDNVLKKIINQI